MPEADAAFQKFFPTPASLTPLYSPPVEGQTISLFRKLAEVAGKAHQVTPTGVGPGDRFSYATVDDILAVIKPPLTERLVVLTLGEVARNRGVVEYVDRDGQPVCNPYIDVLVQCTFHDGESGESYSFHVTGSRPDHTGTGGTGSYTAALKTALAKTFLIPIDTDEASPGTASPVSPPRQGSPRASRPAVGTLPFGRGAGKTVSEAATDDLKWIRGKIKTGDACEAKYREANEAMVSAIDAELQLREMADE